MKRIIEYKISSEYDGKTVLQFLKNRVGASARLIRNLKNIEKGITLNGEHIRTVDLMREGDILALKLPDDSGDDAQIVEPLDFHITVLYEDEDLLIVDKPAGIALHPSHNHQGDTLANAVSHYLLKKGKKAVFRSVGRLDKGTSGIVICALNKFSAAKLQGKKIYKEYMAVAEGFYEGKGVIDRPIYRPDPIITVRTVDSRGERAVTEWSAVKHGNGRTLLKIHLVTGRTHQIRVHFSSLGTPLTGDTMYGTPSREISHQALHCSFVRFNHPVTNKEISITSPLPCDMKRLIE